MRSTHTFLLPRRLLRDPYSGRLKDDKMSWMRIDINSAAVRELSLNNNLTYIISTYVNMKLCKYLYKITVRCTLVCILSVTDLMKACSRMDHSDFIFSTAQEYPVEIRCDAGSKGVVFVSIAVKLQRMQSCSGR